MAGRSGAAACRYDTTGGWARDASLLEFTLLRKPATTVLNGGPLLGLGARLDAPRFRMRFGYEAAVPWWMLWSASVETDFRAMTTLVPGAEIASPNVWAFIPSVALGAGVPVQLRSAQAAVGGRIQLTASWPVVSLVMPIDFFPVAAADRWQVALFGQASF
ncbi:MAG: hypothetical protein ABSG58_08200 [Acidimicrobiales bacterium]